MGSSAGSRTQVISATREFADVDVLSIPASVAGVKVALDSFVFLRASRFGRLSGQNVQVQLFEFLHWRHGTSGGPTFSL